MMAIPLWWLFLAQAESSGVADFFGQIGGLVGLTCAAGVIWVALTAFVFQRAAERRRRAAQGLEPLPNLYTSFWRTLRGQRGAPDDATARLNTLDARLPDPLPRPSALAPDLALLTGARPATSLAPAPPALSPKPDDRTAPPEPQQEPPPDPIPDPPVDTEPFDALPPSPDESWSGDEAGDPGDAVELLRVWRDLATGELVMEIEGRRFRSVDDLRSADLERRFSGVVRDLSALARQPGAAPQGARLTAPPSGSALQQIGRVALGQASAEQAAPGPRSIADQIEDLLQQRLAGVPAFRGRAIHVRPSVLGGVQIVVDNRQYEGIGEIDDPEVRALLEDVVREWEGSQ